jgi:hypothetical protein
VLRQLAMLWRLSLLPDQAGQNITSNSVSVRAAADLEDVDDCAATGRGQDTHPDCPTRHTVGHWGAAAAVCIMDN